MTSSNYTKGNQSVSAKKTAPSFFDRMEDLETNEIIGMSILNKVKPLAAEHGSEDVPVLNRMLERKGG